MRAGQTYFSYLVAFSPVHHCNPTASSPVALHAILHDRNPASQTRRFKLEDLDPDLPDKVREHAEACVRAYHSQATKINLDKRADFIDIIKGGDFIPPKSAKTVGGHKLYHRATDTISWPVWVVLNAVYPNQKMPPKLVAAAKASFPMTAIVDYTAEYRAVHPDPAITTKGHAAGKKTVPTPKKRQASRVQLVPTARIHHSRRSRVVNQHVPYPHNPLTSLFLTCKIACAEAHRESTI